MTFTFLQFILFSSCLPSLFHPTNNFSNYKRTLSRICLVHRERKCTLITTVKKFFVSVSYLVSGVYFLVWMTAATFFFLFFCFLLFSLSRCKHIHLQSVECLVAHTPFSHLLVWLADLPGFVRGVASLANITDKQQGRRLSTSCPVGQSMESAR